MSYASTSTVVAWPSEVRYGIEQEGGSLGDRQANMPLLVAFAAAAAMTNAAFPYIWSIFADSCSQSTPLRES